MLIPLPCCDAVIDNQKIIFWNNFRTNFPVLGSPQLPLHFSIWLSLHFPCMYYSILLNQVLDDMMFISLMFCFVYHCHLIFKNHEDQASEMSQILFILHQFVQKTLIGSIKHSCSLWVWAWFPAPWILSVYCSTTAAAVCFVVCVAWGIWEKLRPISRCRQGSIRAGSLSTVFWGFGLWKFD